ncbi:MAG: hypothetical protein J6W84_04125 [Bacteroidales bacterium]|nr:hypothetical protein [Bacteroidales bacterium]
MKKLLAIFAVAAFVFAACGQKPAEEPQTEEVVANEEVVPEAQEEETANVEAEGEVAQEGEVAETPAE